MLGQNRYISSDAFYAVLGDGTQVFLPARQSLQLSQSHQRPRGKSLDFLFSAHPLAGGRMPIGNGVSFAETEMFRVIVPGHNNQL